MDPVTVKQEIFKHFDNRFNNCSNTRIEYNNDVVYPVTLTQDQQVCLEDVVSDEEIKNAVWDCGKDKSLGPDGFTFYFIRKFWEVIVGKILANRLSRVIGRLVSKEQSAFIRGRQILDGPMIFSEVIEWCNQKKKKAMIFKVDFEKAYDSGCLISSSASILVDGSPTNEFQFQQGLRQGDPLSSFLFLLVMESLHISFVRAMEV
ncbi:RNA-directed DNA polymerase, eukaryota, partial [Tanacetum coccineum]